MAKIIIDAAGGIFGRLCGFIAKKALGGEEVIVVNCEKVIIIGRKESIIEKYKILRKKGRGGSLKGPGIPKSPFMLLKRGIKGMLPDFRRGIGKQAFSRIKCYNGVPKEFEGQKMIKSGKQKPKKYITLKLLSERL